MLSFAMQRQTVSPAFLRRPTPTCFPALPVGLLDPCRLVARRPETPPPAPAPADAAAAASGKGRRRRRKGRRGARPKGPAGSASTCTPEGAPNCPAHACGMLGTPRDALNYRSSNIKAHKSLPPLPLFPPPPPPQNSRDRLGIDSGARRSVAGRPSAGLRDPAAVFAF
ncbi:MAG: hypothetical protein BJ554DRAFT_3197 [Olpidium bornovanus]|uniref:Uncharacterized protein n=1 Tax=Olpidium bornovanus TaxID=278681 RepID=A0A8H8DG15_9FUNG|nr:MAG: hypothetical protein BJ554DRAFT_3197 [Olpidium bornovanus]